MKKENPLSSVYDPLGVKLLTHLRREFSRLNEHKFLHGFKRTLNFYVLAELKLKPLNFSSCICQLYSTHRSELFDKIVKVDQPTTLTAKDQVLALLYGPQRNNSENSN